jgi:hypothetical protein
MVVDDRGEARWGMAMGATRADELLARLTSSRTIWLKWALACASLSGCGASTGGGETRGEPGVSPEGLAGDGSLGPCADVELGCYRVAWEHQLDFGDDASYSGMSFSPLGTLFVAGTTVGGFPESPVVGETDAFVVSLDPSSGTQTLGWAYHPGAAETGTAIAATREGDVLLFGITQSSGTPFLAKFTPMGEQLWRTELTEGPSSFSGWALEVDEAGNSYVAGTGLPGEGAGFLGFVLKFDSSGQPLWTRPLQGERSSSARGLALDGDRGVVIAGQLDLAESSGAALVIKLDAEGNELWTTLLDADNTDAANEVAVDGLGRIVVTGTTQGELMGQPSGGGTDAFVAQLDPQGEVRWIRQWGGEAEERAYDVKVTPAGRVFVSGTSLRPGTPDGEAGEVWPWAADGFLYEIDSDGVESRQHELPMSDGRLADFPYEVRLDSSGDLYIAGANYEDDDRSADFADPSTGFVLKLELPAPR